MLNDALWVGFLKGMLFKHEGCKLIPYTDTTGHLTIGVGRNLTSIGLSHKEVEFLLENDISYFVEKLSDFPWFSSLNNVRKCAIVDMTFNLGLNGFLEFKKLIHFLEIKEWENAADEMLNSKWATQVGERAIELAKMMETGEFQ